MRNKDQILLENLYSKQVLKEGYKLTGTYHSSTNPRTSKFSPQTISTIGVGWTKEEALKNWLYQYYGDTKKEIPKNVTFKWRGWDKDDEWNKPPYAEHEGIDVHDIVPDTNPPGGPEDKKILDAEEMGKNSTVYGVDDVSDEELLKQIAEKEKNVKSWMGAVLLSGLKAEAKRRGLELGNY